MKNKKFILISIILVLIIGILFFINNKIKDNNSDEIKEDEAIKIIFSEKFLNVAENTPEQWIESLKSTGENQYIDVYVNEDGKTVTLEIKEVQREHWKKAYENSLEALKNKLNNINSNYRIEVNEDYSNIDMYYNLDLSAYDAMYYVIHAEGICICQQLINGVNSEEWKVSFNIYNSDTGKIVTSGDSNTGLSYEAEDWEKSL